MKLSAPRVLAVFGVAGAAIQLALAAPPYGGTIFLDPDIITAADPTTYQHITAAGRGMRKMFDRRVDDYVYLNASLFDATFDDGLAIEIEVNPEFDATAAAQAAAKYAAVIGRLPTCLRSQVRTVWIHQGIFPFGGGSNNLLIHTGQADLYAADGILEETLVHEASHTSLDDEHATAPGWLAAQAADPEFISTYARDYPYREDIAESFLVYLAIRHRADRIAKSMADTIVRTLPNRIAYFDSLPLDFYPIVAPPPLAVTGFSYDAATASMHLAWVSRPGKTYAVDVSTDLTHWQELVGNIPSQGHATDLTYSLLPARDRAFFTVRELAQPPTSAPP